MSTLQEKPPRFEARISRDQQALIKRAAELEGRTLTDFGLKAMIDEAHRVIAQASVIQLVQADQEQFAQALISPPPATPGLARAIERRAALLRDA